MTSLPPSDPSPGIAAEPGRDAYLHGALRHAPDADAAPPAALSDAILRAAQAAVAGAPPRRSAAKPSGLPRLLAEGWAWFGQPRRAGSFAGVMLATLVGVWWWGQALEPGLEPLPQAPSRSNDSARAPVAAAAPADFEVAAVRSKVAQAPLKLEDQSPAATARAVTQAPTEARKARAEAPDLARAGASADATAATAPAAEPAAEARVAAAEVTATAPAADRVGATAALPAAPAAAALARRSNATAKQSAALSAAGAPALAENALSDAAGALAWLRKVIAAQPERWTWRLGADAPRAMSAELQAWLSRLDAAAGAAVDRAEPPSLDVGANPAKTLHLLRDAQAHSHLDWASAGVQLTLVGNATPVRRAALAPQIARELDAALARLAGR